MQERQTVIFGTLIAALLVIGLVAGAMWSGVLPSPITVPINSGGVESPDPVTPPCPPADATWVPYNEISVNVLNGTDTRGLAASTAARLLEIGVQISSEQNGAPYGGVVKITTGPLGVSAAYTMAALFPSSQIVLDSREDETLDLLVGDGYEELVPEDERQVEAEAAIPAPADCRPVETSTDDSEDE